jgi:hypothetical protein
VGYATLTVGDEFSAEIPRQCPLVLVREVGEKVRRWAVEKAEQREVKLIETLFKYSVRTSKRTQNFTITKINLLTLFKEIITVYTENHAKPTNTKCTVTNY